MPHARRQRVAVVGAGVAGLACARRLADQDVAVTVFDKGRGAGGRVSTRRMGVAPDSPVDRQSDVQFDHGATDFAASDPAFVAAVEAWKGDGRVEDWTPRVVRLDGRGGARPEAPSPRLVGVPGMSGVAAALLGEGDRALPLLAPRRIAHVEFGGYRWRLLDDFSGSIGPFDALVVAIPAPQAGVLLTGSTALAPRLASIAMLPCWAVMASWSGDSPAEFDAAIVEDGPLGWIVDNASKPGRPAGSAWVLHATTAWSSAHLEDAAPEVADALVQGFRALVPRDPGEPAHAVAHRWRFARAERPAGEACLVDAGRSLVVCGDWCLGDTVEAAWRSGSAAADAVLALA